MRTPTLRRFLHSSRMLRGHENPLGLPQTQGLPQKGSIPRFQRGLPQKRPINGVSHIVAVSSAKGGVGKSTIAANLSLALARLGLRAGILDTDIFGPSIPTLFDLTSHTPHLSPQNQLIPLTNYGVKTMSIGYLTPDESAPVVWRGPMLLKAIQQLLHEVDWAGAGGLDILVLDLPPGTGDIQLSIAQQVPVDGAVIVSTPHVLAVKDAVKGVGMFEKVGVPVLGLVRNMGVFKCPCCGGETEVFGGNDKVDQMCQEKGIQLLGDVPLHPNIGEDGSRGKPTVAAEPESERAKVFMEVARKVAAKVGLRV
ncbi:putative nucleotide binding protein [Thermochaetoides thermophila DSM 1495]|uniref:Putative nucleotide binding protein n=1 Tax=Chaetomium thermophilum (strain DSM 1495 / CBS 144.50 / IMI 039719) TaxID=759272 RepID=G0SAJ5_CHATD|nr:putative nucleotide binding protein [Thermochaetoides thermophila DSM 1495]EGS19767.1 putative nucleotide binding protein [Thermochaetoides thermophila DSM 1495]